MILPDVSMPLLPALPDIYTNSAPVNGLDVSPSNLEKSVNTTVLAGILTPIENVSVLNNTFIKLF